jgi:hypothetical protein
VVAGATEANVAAGAAALKKFCPAEVEGSAVPKISSMEVIQAKPINQNCFRFIFSNPILNSDILAA